MGVLVVLSLALITIYFRETSGDVLHRQQGLSQLAQRIREGGEFVRENSASVFSAAISACLIAMALVAQNWRRRKNRFVFDE